LRRLAGAMPRAAKPLPRVAEWPGGAHWQKICAELPPQSSPQRARLNHTGAPLGSQNYATALSYAALRPKTASADLAASSSKDAILLARASLLSTEPSAATAT